MTKVFVGTSGYNYLHWWNGVFYPPDVPQRKWLEFYAQHFDTVELNVSFYRLPKRKVFEGWRNRTPNNFIFAVKGSRFITHVKKLAGCEDPLKLFFDNASGLKEKLGIVLWQLPPGLHMNEERLEEFCGLLAQNEIARNTRHAFEFRHKSWFCDEIYELLSKYNFSLCVAHSNRWPFVEISTADFVYLRFHGGEILYGSNYSDGELKGWSSEAKKWLHEGRDIYAYFNNDAYGFAVYNALKLRELIQG
ncbi:MAG: DUF72 domain-containing protein [Actinomycetota bacterium]|nr:DUF72 domain-containing protein [Actinomycetota bacterium]MDI6822637.1 DUF72 domain-containing protein [Actinomycetota bacterium]